MNKEVVVETLGEVNFLYKFGVSPHEKENQIVAERYS